MAHDLKGALGEAQPFSQKHRSEPKILPLLIIPRFGLLFKVSSFNASYFKRSDTQKWMQAYQSDPAQKFLVQKPFHIKDSFSREKKKKALPLSGYLGFGPRDCSNSRKKKTNLKPFTFKCGNEG